MISEFKIKFDHNPDFGFTTEEFNKLQSLIDKLNSCYNNDRYNFANTCYFISEIKKLFDKYNMSSFVFTREKKSYYFQDIMNGFELDKTQVSRLLSCFEKYIYVDVVLGAKVKDIYYGFSKSKLFELLPVDDDTLVNDIKNKVLRPNMSVKAIRDYVKNYNKLQKANSKIKDEEKENLEEESEEDIPMAYDPTKYYDFDYFEDKNKAQLLNIVWSLQGEYQKLKEKYKNKNK